MGERTQYTPGTFSWTDLTTTDQDAAKTFYIGLFGWEIEDMPAGDGMTYSMAHVDGKVVAAIAPQPQMLRDQGVPPTWNSYVTVESADDAAAKATELGGTVMGPPFDVFDSGRMSVIQDPQGAFFSVWQPRNHIGAQLVNVPGAFCWNELATPDFDAAQAFYGGLFGWSLEQTDMAGDQPYLAIKNGEAMNGGVTSMLPPGVPPHWATYFATDDLDAAMTKVGELGGAVHVGPIEISIARIAVVADPQGASFYLYDGELDP
jgi:predicted enzyme related to lactoylglutathione lyase